MREKKMKQKAKLKSVHAKIMLVAYLSLVLLFPAFACATPGGQDRLSNWLFHQIEEQGAELIHMVADHDHGHHHTEASDHTPHEANHSHDYTVNGFVGIAEKTSSGIVNEALQEILIPFTIVAEITLELAPTRVVRQPPILALKSQIQLRRSVVLVV